MIKAHLLAEKYTVSHIFSASRPETSLTNNIVIIHHIKSGLSPQQQWLVLHFMSIMPRLKSVPDSIGNISTQTPSIIIQLIQYLGQIFGD